MTKNSGRWIFESSYNKKKFKNRISDIWLSLLVFLFFLFVPIYVIGIVTTCFIYFDEIFDIIVSGKYSAKDTLQFILYLFVSNEILLYILQMLTSVLTAFSAAYFYAVKYQYSILSPFKRKQIKSSTSKYFLFVCIGATVASGFIITFVRYFLENFNIIENYGSSASSFPTSIAGIILYFTSTVIIAPLTEEYFFRGILFEELAPYGVKFAIFFSSVAFGLMHRSLTILFFALVFGIFNSILYIKTNSLTYPIIAHIIINLISFVENVIANTQYDDLVLFFHYFSSALIFFAATFSAIMLIRKKHTLLGSQYNKTANNRINIYYISKNTKFIYMFINIPFIFFLLTIFIAPIVDLIFT